MPIMLLIDLILLIFKLQSKWFLAQSLTRSPWMVLFRLISLGFVMHLMIANSDHLRCLHIFSCQVDFTQLTTQSHRDIILKYLVPAFNFLAKVETFGAEA